VHYFFWPEERFRRAVEEGHFLEWASVYGRLYGTPVDEVVSRLEEGLDVLLDLDIQGARQVKRRMPEAILIFILPPSLDVLSQRMTCRGTETAEERVLRLAAAVEFVRAAEEFDYIVVNDELEEAVRCMEAVVRAEHCRTPRQIEIVRRLTGATAGNGPSAEKEGEA